MANVDIPKFGLWYGFRQRLPFEQDYASFYAEYLVTLFGKRKVL